MNKITFPITHETQGQALRDLQDALLEFLKRNIFPFTPPELENFRFELSIERDASRYKDATRKLVSVFQEMRGIQGDGFVEEKTATVMNELLKELGMFEPAVKANQALRIISGRVSRSDGQAFAGGGVRLFQEAAAGVFRLGEDPTDAEGKYTIRYEPIPGIESVDLRVSVADATGKILLNSELITTAKLIEVQNLSLPALKPDAELHRVDGRIFLEHGLPATGMNLRLYQLGFGGAQGARLLAETTTQEHGLYSLPYQRSATSNNLELRAVDAAGNEIPLSSKVLNAGKQEVMNLVAPGLLQPLSAEFARLSSDLNPHIGGEITALLEAQEHVDRADLTLLNEATGWDARLIALAASAVKLSTAEETGLPTEVLYGALRVGLPSDKLQLAQVSTSAFEQGLEKARTAGIIQLDDAEFVAAKDAFETFSVNTRLSLSTPGSLTTYNELLEQSGLNETEQQAFAKLYFKYQDDTKTLWEQAEAIGSGLENAVPLLKAQGKLAYLTTNNPQVMAGIKDKLGDRPLTALVTEGYYKKEQWSELIGATAPIFQDKETYAEDMARKVRISYSTEVTWNMIRMGEMDVSGLGSAGTLELLLKNAIAEGFKLGQMPVDKFIKDNPSVLNGIEESQKNTAQEALKALQRVYQITPGNDAMKILLSEGLFSAQDVLAYPLDVFLERYGSLLNLDQATLIYRKCEQVSNVTTSIFTLTKELDNAAPIFAMSATSEVRKDAKTKLINEFPNMAGLFGSLDFCECEHCRSVLSPAAYLVDLLQFLDPEVKVWQNAMKDWKNKHGSAPYPFKDTEAFGLFEQRWQAAHPLEPVPNRDITPLTPYEILISRRPDIPNIPLTCENTNTELPQIDLVNEILEYYVAHHSLGADTAHDTGDATSSELIAEPQYIEPEAYKTLQNARYPLNLPFDLWLETARQFCAYFDTPLWQLLESFRSSDALFEPLQSYDRAAIFIESLGISPSELAVFTNPNPLDDWFTLYGFERETQALTSAIDADSGQRIDLNSAKALSRRLGISYKELLEVVRTGFVNPQLNAFVVLYKLGIEINDVLFYKKHLATYQLNEDLLDKKRKDLTPADQTRFDAITKAAWDVLHEVHGIVAKLKFLSKAFPDFDAVDWLNTALQNNDFDQILVLADTSTAGDFDKTTLQYANGNKVDGFALLKINLFVRLWRKLNWSIADTDRALQAFMPKNAPFEAEHLAKQPLLTVLIYLSHLRSLETKMNVGKNSLSKLLSLWTDLPTQGKNPLYARHFLSRSALRSDPVFDDPLGLYLSKPDLLLKDHLLVIQGALGLSVTEINQILSNNGLDLESAALTLAHVSLLYRHGLLAKALKLDIGELLSLKQLSGLDPFKSLHPDPLDQLENDFPFSQTIRFVEMLDALKASGFDIQDLNYLLRHQFDASGKYRPDEDALWATTKAIALGIRAIQNEHVIPNDPSALPDDELRSKLGLVLPSNVVNRLLAMLDGTNEVTVVQGGVDPDHQLQATDFAGDMAIQKVNYNTVRQEQTMVFRGILLDAQKMALKAKFNSKLSVNQKMLFSTLLDAVQLENSAFFSKYLQKQALNANSNAGFFEAADYGKLFEVLPLVPDGLSEIQKRAAEKAREDKVYEKRGLLIQAFLPYLQTQLVRQLIVQTISAANQADQVLIESLLSDPLLLTDPIQIEPKPLLSAFSGLGTKGISASFYTDPNLNGAETNLVFLEIDTGLRDHKGNLLRPTNIQSCRFEGYLEVSTAGAYRFYTKLAKKNASATLRFAHLHSPVFVGVAAQDEDTLGKGAAEFIELKPGIAYRFSLELQNLNGGEALLQVQGEQLPVGGLSRLTLYAASSVEHSTRAQILLQKTLALVQKLGLSERELRYFLTHAANFDHISFSALPTQAIDDTPSVAIQRFTWFCRLMAYKALREEMAGGSGGLIEVMEVAETLSLDEVCLQIAQLTRRDQTVIKTTAEALFASPTFKDERTLIRLWQGLQTTTKLGVAAQEINKWTKIISKTTTQDKKFKIAQSLKESIKARFEPEVWQRVAQPIFDKLRQQQRNALVAFIMHLRGFERMDQLFEYFLIDPGVEPVIKTSRIRAAIGAIQVFIQRCLLNMEPQQVAPSAINSKHWQWMKRYRVWEANRKIFLFPENWLEPEFRDDKTHLFTELEGALLQGDVSSDLVEDAFFKYLKKLDELARLDIAGMYCEEDSFDPASSTLHVIGRTFAQPHKYFYRQYKHQIWTPWEPVTAEIQGNHLVPVVWRDRLNLFWVTFLDRADSSAKPSSTGGSLYVAEKPFSTSVEGLTKTSAKGIALVTGSSSGSEAKLVDASIADINNALSSMVATKLVDVQLHWSEYLNGTWSARESGGVAASLTVKVPMTFNPDAAFIHVSKEYAEGEDRAVKINLGGEINRAFRVVSRNSVPVSSSIEAAPGMPYNAPETQANRRKGNGGLKVTFKARIETEDGKPPKVTTLSPNILQQGGVFTLLSCANALTIGSDEIGALVAPVFYQDEVGNTFFIEPSFRETSIEEWQEWVKKRTETDAERDDLGFWQSVPLAPMIPQYRIPIPLDFDDPVWKRGIDSRTRLDFLAQKDWLANPTTLIQFNGELIGQSGRTNLQVLSTAEAKQLQTAIPIAVSPGSESAGILVSAEQVASSAGSVVQATSVLNVIGSNGLNTALVKSVNLFHNR